MSKRIEGRVYLQIIAHIDELLARVSLEPSQAKKRGSLGKYGEILNSRVNLSNDDETKSSCSMKKVIMNV